MEGVRVSTQQKNIFIHSRSNFQLIACWVPREELMGLRKEKKVRSILKLFWSNERERVHLLETSRELNGV